VLLALVYYRCPMLCTQILTGLESSLKAVSSIPAGFRSGRRQLRSQGHARDRGGQEAELLQRYRRPNTANGWHFLTGDEANIKALTDAVGFHYKYDPKPPTNTRTPAPS
jgi:protein SCO1